MTEEQIQALMQASDSDQEAALKFTQKLLRDWMRRNTIEGMTIQQSLWVFARFEEFKITIDGMEKKIDLFKMFQAGAIPTLYYNLLRIVPDDFTKPYHWITQQRINWILEQIENHIGTQMSQYIRGLQ